MQRIRTIKPDFFSHEPLFDLENETKLPIRLAFAGLWTCCDREGRFKWRVRTLKRDILPHDNLDFSRVLDALATRGFVVKYSVNHEYFGWVPTFLEHQHINNREAASKLPEPPENIEETVATVTRPPRVKDASHKEGKGKERNNIYSEKNFEEFWKAYPRKTAKGAAKPKYRVALSKASHEEIMAGLKAFKFSPDKQFIPHPATWLHQERWLDEGDKQPDPIDFDDPKWWLDRTKTRFSKDHLKNNWPVPGKNFPDGCPNHIEIWGEE